MLQRAVRTGETISISAAGSIDPDSDRLSYHWWHYAEPGTFRGKLRLENVNTAKARIVVPQVTAPATAHVILEVTDSGDPRLTSYRRVVFTLRP